jgi:hypothetical protein
MNQAFLSIAMKCNAVSGYPRTIDLLYSFTISPSLFPTYPSPEVASLPFSNLSLQLLETQQPKYWKEEQKTSDSNMHVAFAISCIQTPP